MKIIKKSNIINKISNNIENIGFVPTMGALHDGHISLIKESKKRAKKTIVSIFVNPRQFNNKKDFKNYPNKTSEDLIKCKKLQVDYVFIPNLSEIYNWKSKRISYPKIKKIMEDKFRRGHFKGVLNVMSKLLSIIKCNYLFMGKKDFQQLALIQNLIEINNLNCTLIKCNTIRHKNGYPLSSRNLLLKAKDLSLMGNVYYHMKKYKKKLKITNFNQKIIKKNIEKLGVKKIDYIELIDLKNMERVKKLKKNTNLFIAYYIDNIRLIDNL